MSSDRNPGVRVAENDLLGGDDEGVSRAKMSPTLLGSKLDVRALYDPGDGYVLGFADGTTMSFGDVPVLSSLPRGLHSGDQEKVIGRSPAVAMARFATGVLLATAEGAILRVGVERSRLIDQGGGATGVVAPWWRSRRAIAMGGTVGSCVVMGRFTILELHGGSGIW